MASNKWELVYLKMPIGLNQIKSLFSKESSFYRYLGYALGESILVIISILVAVKIDNYNEDRKSRENIIVALKQIQSELITSAKDAEAVIDFYINADTMMYNIMSGKLTEKDYVGETGNRYALVGMGYTTLSVEMEGFNTLMSKSEDIPEDFNQVVSELKYLYLKNVKLVEEMNKTMSNTTLDFFKWRMVNTDWAYQEYFNDKTLTKDKINFFLKNPYYKNYLQQYNMIGIGNHSQVIMEFRSKAEECYNKLDSLLYPDGKTYTENHFTKTDTTGLSQLMGNYQFEKDTIKLSTSGNKILFQINNDNKVPVFMINNKRFVPDAIKSGSLPFYYFNYENDSLNGIRVKLQDINVFFKKI
ncbi:MAG: hypothetical protein ACK492_07400 [Chitinophagaceae bacterium]